MINIFILLYACVNTTLMIVSIKNKDSISDMYFKTCGCLMNVLMFAWNIVVIKLIKPVCVYKVKIEASPASSTYETARSANSNTRLVHSATVSTLDTNAIHNNIAEDVLPRPQSTPV